MTRIRLAPEPTPDSDIDELIEYLRVNNLGLSQPTEISPETQELHMEVEQMELEEDFDIIEANYMATIEAETAVVEVTEDKKFNTYSEFIEHIKQMFNEHYGEDKVDITYDGTTYLIVKIHYPIVEISNSRGKHHTMTDFYVILYFGLNESHFSESKQTTAFKLSKFSGRRLSGSSKEIISGYCWSHLSANAYGFVNDDNHFCMGSSTGMSFMHQKLCEGIPSIPLFLENLEMFMFLLDEYLTWESLEGTPYKYMENISSKGSLVATGDINPYNGLGYFGHALALVLSNYILTHKELIKRFITECTISSHQLLRYNLYNSQYFIEETLEEMLLNNKITIENNKEDYKSILYKVSPTDTTITDIEGKVTTTTLKQVNDFLRNFKEFVFKGKKQSFVLTDEKEINNTTTSDVDLFAEDIIISPEITKQIIIIINNVIKTLRIYNYGREES